jgi:hypothetical protein
LEVKVRKNAEGPKSATRSGVPNGTIGPLESISAIVTAVMTQLRETLPEEHEKRLAVFDSGGYSEATMKRYNEAKIKWISRVPETCTCQEEGHSQQKGRPKKEASPNATVWHVISPLSVDQQLVEAQIKKQASFIVANSLRRRKPFPIRSTSLLTARLCAGSFSALRALTFSTFAWDHDGKPRSWGCNLFINVFSVCLALPFVNGIFCLRKLRNVEFRNVLFPLLRVLHDAIFQKTAAG